MKTWLKRLLFGLLASMLVLAVWIGLGIRSTLNTLPDAYAIWGTGELIIAHLEDTDDFPKSWRELEPFWGDGHGAHARPGGIRSIQQLEKMVHIQFDRLEEHRDSAASGQKPSKLIIAKSGATTRWEGADADEMIVEYLENNKD